MLYFASPTLRAPHSPTMANLDYASARLAGARMYTGAPCKYGHTGTRYTQNRACVECERIKGAANKARRADTERERKRRYERENRERVNAAQRARRARMSPAQRAAVLARKREYERADPNGVLAARRARRRAAAQVRRAERAAYKLTPEYRKARAVKVAEMKARQKARAAEKRRNRTPEQIASDRVKARAYYLVQKARNPERLAQTWRDAQRIRRARKRGATIKATVADASLIRDLQGHVCAYCGKGGQLHLDHKQPLSCGGQHAPPNLQWLCPRHNMSKHDKTDKEYRALHGIPETTRWDCLL